MYYTWPAATHNSNIEMTQGACPVGWHLPSNGEWQQLLTELGGEAVAGGKLKGIQTFFWSSTFDQQFDYLSTAWSVSLNNATSGAYISPYYRTDMGFSVRCIKN